MDFTPKTLADYWDPVRNEQAREQSQFGALQAEQKMTEMKNAQLEQTGLAMLYKNIAPQKDESGKVTKSKYFDPETKTIDWTGFLTSPEGNEWAQQHPKIATAVFEKVGLMGTSGKVPMGAKFTEYIEQEHPEAAGMNPSMLIRNYGEGFKKWMSDAKLGSISSEKQWEDAKAKELITKNPSLSPDKARMQAIEEWNKQIRPIAATETFERKERFNLDQLKGAFENPAGSYKKGDREGRYSPTGIISFRKLSLKVRRLMNLQMLNHRQGVLRELRERIISRKHTLII